MVCPDSSVFNLISWLLFYLSSQPLVLIGLSQDYHFFSIVYWADTFLELSQQTKNKSPDILHQKLLHSKFSGDNFSDVDNKYQDTDCGRHSSKTKESLDIIASYKKMMTRLEFVIIIRGSYTQCDLYKSQWLLSPRKSKKKAKGNKYILYIL